MSNDKVTGVQEALTAAFIASLEEGIANPKGWKAPWHAGLLGAATNAATHRPYQGGNALLLSVLESIGDHSGPWATYKQWEGIGAQVRKGERSTWILAPRTLKREQDDGTVRTWTAFKAFPVFAASQVDGYSVPDLPPVTGEALPAADAFLEGVARVITVAHHDAGEAFYVPHMDRVTVPKRELFKTMTGFYSTHLHELTHATGHVSRLNRGTLGQPFGSPDYAREELVAELGSAFLGAHLGIATELRDDHRDYLANWLAVLRDDHTAVWKAASAASKAAEWLIEASGTRAAAAA